jgi:DNA repair protein RadC
MQLDAFETNGASPPRRARGFAYRLRTVTLRLNEQPAEKLSDPTSALAFFRSIFATLDGDREHLVLLALDTQNAVCGYKVVATGGQAASIVDAKTLFRDALLLGAAGIIVAHNHPSGDPTPSREDLRLTRQLSEAGKLLDLRVHDHLVLGHGDRFVSLADRGLMEG